MSPALNFIITIITTTTNLHPPLLLLSSSSPPVATMDVDGPPPSPNYFVQLPRELLDTIAGFLPTRDFNNLRLSCKHVENILFPYWANCFFRVRQFMISELSLDTLLDISRHPVLSKHLTHLAIGLDHLQHTHTGRVQGFSSYDDAHAYDAALASQALLFHTGEAVRLLSAALANLPNLGYIDIRDYSSPTRFRDAGQWNSYGSSIHRNMHWHGHVLPGRPMAPMAYTVENDFVAKVFQVLVAALGQASSSCPVRRLDVITKKTHLGLDDSAFALVRAPDDGLRTILGGLTTLHLNLALNNRVYHVYRDPTRLQLAWDGHYNLSTLHLQKFLALTPNLTWLRLNSNNSAYDEEIARVFFTWLSLQPGDPLPEKVSQSWRSILTKPVALPLKRLELGAWRLPFQLWVSLLRKYTGLTHLSLFRTSAYTDKTRDPHQEPQWAEIIRVLPATTPGLQSIQLSNVQEGPISRVPQRVIFLDQNVPDQRPRPTVARDIVDKDDIKKLADSLMLSSVYRSRRDKARGNAGSDDTDSDSSDGSDDSDGHTDNSEDIEESEDDSDI